MAKRGRPTVEIKLRADERGTLERWARRHSSSQALALRCRIVLACAEDRSNSDVATELGVNAATVSKWRHRFAQDRLDGLMDAPRPGAARTIGDDVVEAVVVETLETTPPDATHWSTRALAAKHGISHQTVAEIWQAFGLKPWRQDSFKVSPDPQLVEKIRDIVGLYMNPPVAAAVFAVDEKRIQRPRSRRKHLDLRNPRVRSLAAPDCLREDLVQALRVRSACSTSRPSPGADSCGCPDRQTLTGHTRGQAGSVRAAPSTRSAWWGFVGAPLLMPNTVSSPA